MACQAWKNSRHSRGSNADEKATNESRSEKDTDETKLTADTKESIGSDSDDLKLFTDLLFTSQFQSTRQPTQERKPPKWLKDYVSKNFAEILLVDDYPKTCNESIK